MLYLIVSILDPCCLSYFYCELEGISSYRLQNIVTKTYFSALQLITDDIIWFSVSVIVVVDYYSLLIVAPNMCMFFLCLALVL